VPLAPEQNGVRHFFTVDVEEYFQVVALAPYAPMSRWENFESRVEASVDELLALMALHGTKGTFFTVGWVAERKPDMMRRIVAAGHEVASHTYDKRVIEDITGSQVIGFRAPSFSIVPGTEWALDILLEEGHRYDSSLFPVRRSGYGYPGGGRDPYWIERPAGRLAEFPPATLQVAGLTLPAAGGAYFRLLPPNLVHSALNSSAARGAAGTFYIHPWEWDPGQPRLAVPLLTRIRHYGGQGGVLARLATLLETHQFGAIRDAM
jgi:hypothetical protein